MLGLSIRLCVGVALMWSSSPIFSQQLEPFSFASPKPGTKLTYKNLVTGVITNQTYLKPGANFDIQYQTSDSKAKVEYLFCKYCGSDKNEIDVSNYQELFPLTVGKTTEFSRWRKNNPETSWTHAISVQETKQVVSQFDRSSVDVFVVHETIANNQNNWKGSVTYWFSPELKSYVSIIDNAEDNLDLVSITQLVDIVLP